jgi:hypothetical protein
MDGHVEFFGEFLQFDFPETHTAAIATTPVGHDQQLGSLWVEPNSHSLPPAANSRNGEFGGVMVDPDAYAT